MKKRHQREGYQGLLITASITKGYNGERVDGCKDYPLEKFMAILDLKYGLEAKLEQERQRLLTKWRGDIKELDSKINKKLNREEPQNSDVNIDQNVTHHI